MKNVSHWAKPALVLGAWLLGSFSGHCFCSPEGRNEELVANSVGYKASLTSGYGSFDELLGATEATAKANPFRFSTKYQDDETDLVYYGYRYYNASTGRWLSRDPIEQKGGLNLYGFVGNNPISRVDPFGLWSWHDFVLNNPEFVAALENALSWLVAQAVDARHIKYTFTHDVTCKCGKRTLLSETERKVTITASVEVSVFAIDVYNQTIWKPIEHVVRRVYGCCSGAASTVKNTHKYSTEPIEEHSSEWGPVELFYGTRRKTYDRELLKRCQEVTPESSHDTVDVPN